MTDFELRKLWRHLGAKTADEEVREWREPRQQTSGHLSAEFAFIRRSTRICGAR